MSIYYQRSGQGMPVVLLHGWGFHSDIWQPLIDQAASLFDFHVVDLPGFGRSQSLTFDRSLHHNIQVLLPYLPPKALYVGWSLGGVLAMQLASSLPERVTGVLALASSPCFLQKSDWKGVSRDYFDAFYQQVADHPHKTLKSFILMGLVGTADRRQHTAELWALLNAYGLPQTVSLLNGLWALQDTDLSAAMDKLPLPIFYAMGQHDPLTPYRDTSNTIPLQSSGHFSLWTDAAEVYALLQRVNHACIRL